jgi:hypothetical protein
MAAGPSIFPGRNAPASGRHAYPRLFAHWSGPASVTEGDRTIDRRGAGSPTLRVCPDDGSV